MDTQRNLAKKGPKTMEKQRKTMKFLWVSFPLGIFLAPYPVGVIADGDSSPQASSHRHALACQPSLASGGRARRARLEERSVGHCGLDLSWLQVALAAK